MVTAVEVSRWFVGSIDREAGDSITHLKVQKLVFYAQAWNLALSGVPLFEDDVQAWAHGPVVDSVYREYGGNSWNALPPPDVFPELEASVEEHLSEILKAYGGLSAKQLENLTHAEAPWIDARGELPPEARSNNVIPREAMRSYYAGLYAEAGSGE